MEERIRKFMEYKGISSSELADSIGVQRSNVTHVLKARNKPSFQFIEKILQIYPELNAKWLLLGIGNMIDGPSKPRTLFDQLTVPENIQEQKTEINIEKPLVQSAPPVESSKQSEIIETEISQIHTSEEKTVPDNVHHNQNNNLERPIERLIIFFNDQTFKVYHPSL